MLTEFAGRRPKKRIPTLVCFTLLFIGVCCSSSEQQRTKLLLNSEGLKKDVHRSAKENLVLATDIESTLYSNSDTEINQRYDSKDYGIQYATDPNAVDKYDAKSQAGTQYVDLLSHDSLNVGNSVKKRPTRATTDETSLSYVVNHNDIQLTDAEFKALAPKLKEMLTENGYTEKATRSGRTILSTKSSLSISTTPASLVYYEDSGPLSLLPNKVQIVADLGVEYILILLINVLDGSNEKLSLGNFTMTHTTNIGERNVTFQYDVSPTYTYENSILNVTGLASVAEYEAAINTLKYQNFAEEATATLRGARITVYDSSTTTSSNVFFVVTSVNDSPYFSSQPDSFTITEGGSLYTTISSTSVTLVGNTIYDPDVGSQKALAVLGADNSHGTWYHGNSFAVPVSIPDGVRDSGGNILRETSIVQTCLVLKEQYITYVPDTNFYGTSSITVVAWDKTGTSSSLSHGDYANVTWTQQGDPFGQDMATVTVIVTPVNDAPNVILMTSLLTHQLGSIQEESFDDLGIPLSKLVDACDDVDLPYDDTKLNIGAAITQVDATNGAWQYSMDNATTWQGLTDFSVLLGSNGDLTSYRVRFLPNDDYYGDAEIKYRCWDFSVGVTGDVGVNSSYAGASGSFSESEVIGIISVINVNDRPYFARGTTAIQLPVYVDASSQNNRGTTVGDLVSTVFRDADATDNPGLAVVGLEENNFGQFQYTCDVIDDIAFTSASARWYSLYSAHGPGYTQYMKPSMDRATLLSSYCSVRFIQSSTASILSAHFDILPWDGSDGASSGSYDINITNTAVTAYGNETIAVQATVVDVPVRPVVSGTQDLLQFTEGDSFLVLFDDVALDQLTSSLGESATVSLVNAQDENEALSIGSAQEYANEQDLISSTGLAVTWNAERTSVTFSGNVQETFYVKSLRSVSYVHLGNNPTTQVLRQFEIEVVDSGGVKSQSFAKNLSLIGINDSPHITTSAPISSSWKIVDFRRGSAPVLLYGSDVTITFTDLDQSAPSLVAVSMDNAYDGSNEMLKISTTVERRINVTSTQYNVEILQVTSAYDVSTNTLTFSLSGSSVTSSDYTNALGHLTYHNLADPPDFRHRVVRLHATDAYGANTEVVNVTVNMLEMNGSAVIDLPAGNLPGTPVISQVLASPLAIPTLQRTTSALHTDAKFSSGDTIRVVFDRDTNMPPFGFYDVTDPIASNGKILTKSSIDELFTFDDALALDNTIINSYTGQWISASVFEITILREGYPQPSIKVGQWKVSAKYRSHCYDSPVSSGASQLYCIRDATSRSNVSLELSPALEGSWGLNVPDLSSIITRDDVVTSGVSYITSGTTNVVSFRPALSQSQLNAICDLGFVGLFGADLSSTFPGLSALLSSCNNKYVNEWDEGLDKTDRIPTVSVLTVLFQSSGATYRSHDVSSNMATNLNKTALVGAVADDTGVDKTALTSYIATRSSTSSILPEHNILLTPTVISSSITRPSTSDITNDNDDIIRSDDIVTIIFDRAVDKPSAARPEDLQKILTIEALTVTDYEGEWTNDVTLTITLRNVTSAITSLSISFNKNRFTDGSFVPDDFIDNPHCVGVAVCGDDDASVGICDTTGRSCRARASVSFQHATTQTVPLSDSSGKALVAWWWVLLLCLFFLVACVIIFWLACLVRKHNKKKKVKEENADRYQSIPPTTPASSFFPHKSSPVSWQPLERQEASDILPLSEVHIMGEELSKSQRSTPLSSRCSRRIAPFAQSSIFSVSQNLSNKENDEPSDANTVGDFHRKVHFAPSPIAPMFHSRSSSRTSSSSFGSLSVTKEDNERSLALPMPGLDCATDSHVESPEMTLSSGNRSILNLRSRMIYDEKALPINTSLPGVGDLNSNPLVKRSSSAQLKWRHAVALVTENLSSTSNGNGHLPLSRHSRRSEGSCQSEIESDNQEADLKIALSLQEGASESGYVPSFSSGSQPSLQSSNGRLSSVSTIADLNPPSRMGQRSLDHRSSISGLPMSWYIGTSSGSSGDVRSGVNSSPRRPSATSLRRSVSSGRRGFNVAEELLWE